jgi:CheY-like chemotaxis protein
MRELPPGSPARPFLERIDLAAQRAADLANQMLAYSGKGQFVVETFRLEDLVEEMADLLRTSISKKAELRIRAGDGAASIRADATQIRQVVLNLITNASDALAKESGTIAVDIGVLDTGLGSFRETWPGEELPAGPYAFLRVSDTGCGMDEATRAKIFDPFFTTKRTGRGLGMAAVLGIVRGHGGAIRVESEPGRGSTVTILVPASDEAPRAIAESDGLRPGRERGKVLVVDDEEMVREVAQYALERKGHQVLLATDGREAVAAFLREGPEIRAVVLDLTMPWMSGEETFRELRRLDPALPVILTSGFNEQDAAERFGGLAPSAFLKKPYRPTELVEKVESVLS